MEERTIFAFDTGTGGHQSQQDGVTSSNMLISLELEAAEKPASLTVMDAETHCHVFDLPSGEWFLGRSADNDIVLNNSCVSRKHLKITVSDNWRQVFIEDLNSGNGTFVDGSRVIQRQELFGGEVLNIGGSCLLRFLEQGNYHRIQYDRKQRAAHYYKDTDLFNRYYFDAVVDLHVRKSRFTQKQLSLILIDCSSIPEVIAPADPNAVEPLLAGLGSWIQTHCCRQNDIPFRCGDTLLALLLPETNISTAHEIALAIHEALARGQIFQDGGASMVLSPFLGVAAMRQGVMTGADLLSRAQEAVVSARRQKGSYVAYFVEKTGLNR
ncbi:MAG: FHA domain-containing protein [Magnetococcales bacterium]|nr:FHA domain-containing protein [Magnetococcales bacterium]